MTTTPPAASTGELKFTDEAYQLLIRYEASRGQVVDCNTLAIVLNTKYKGAWDKINKAKKSLIGMGWYADAGAAANTPKKRKNGEQNGPGAEEVEKESPSKGRGRPKKVKKEEVKEEDSGVE